MSIVFPVSERELNEEWFRASELEVEGKTEEAMKIYLEIAERESDPALSALSMLSAAKCAVKLGRMNEASELFKAAGKMYEKLAEKVRESSPDLSEWARGMAIKCYQLAGEK
ncbi:MAG: hypothetical protein J7J94_01060 [Thaumarchaeota archaeon]|nr:hypothetical protein [Nitrososphaerota archaeon]